MKGAIFIALNEMIVEQKGLHTWLRIIDQAKVEGVYTSTDNYADEQLFTLVSVICDELHLEQQTVLRLFGEYLFHYLHKSHPIFADSNVNFFDFIQSIDNVIHVEVHKLDEHAQTPSITVEQVNDHEALLEYYSPRKLCHLAEGLLLGAAKHYGIAISISQTQCMHHGAKSCYLHLNQMTTQR